MDAARLAGYWPQARANPVKDDLAVGVLTKKLEGKLKRNAKAIAKY